MNYKDLLLTYSNKLYRLDQFINDLYTVIGAEFDLTQGQIEQVVKNSLIDSADLATVEMLEKELKIVPTPTQDLNERKAMIKAKLRSEGTCTLEMLQNVCNAWDNGEILATFEGGKIVLTFVGEYGVPTDLGSLKNAIEEVKPAHLAVLYNFRYLLIKDVEQMTFNELQRQKLNKFAGGS